MTADNREAEIVLQNSTLNYLRIVDLDGGSGPTSAFFHLRGAARLIGIGRVNDDDVDDLVFYNPERFGIVFNRSQENGSYNDLRDALWELALSLDGSGDGEES